MTPNNAIFNELADIPIISLAFGKTREMHIRTNDQTNTHLFLLDPGDFFVLGWQTNLANQRNISLVMQD